MAIQTRIINVERKPRKCPVCGSEILDIIYGTGDMEEIEFFYKYRQAAIMGGDYIPRNPPIWACSCGCKRFRKVNTDGSIAPVKVKMLKNVRRASMDKFIWETTGLTEVLESGQHDRIRYYLVDVVTNLGEKESFRIEGISSDDAEETARSLVEGGGIGFDGYECVSIQVHEVGEDWKKR